MVPGGDGLALPVLKKTAQEAAPFPLSFQHLRGFFDTFLDLAVALFLRSQIRRVLSVGTRLVQRTGESRKTARL